MPNMCGVFYSSSGVYLLFFFGLLYKTRTMPWLSFKSVVVRSARSEKKSKLCTGKSPQM